MPDRRYLSTARAVARLVGAAPTRGSAWPVCRALPARARWLMSSGNAAAATLRPLDELLLLSPPLAEGWSVLLSAIRGQLDLDPALRELVILRIAVLNGADYEWQAHEPVARRCGVTDAQIGVLRHAKGRRPPPTSSARWSAPCWPTPTP